MKIAFISDIHSNFEALNSVLRDISERNITKIYCLGDLLGYLDRPNEVIDLIRKNNIETIIGNNDEDIINQDFKGNEIKEWTYKALSTENLYFMKKLPKTLNVSVAGNRLKLVHGSPASSKEYLREGEENTHKVLSVLEEDILMSAHTHIPYIDFYNHKMIVNSGSVGKPKFGSPNASYAVLNLEEDDVVAEIIEVEYDVKAAVASLKENNFPADLIDEIKSGGI